MTQPVVSDFKLTTKNNSITCDSKDHLLFLMNCYLEQEILCSGWLGNEKVAVVCRNVEGKLKLLEGAALGQPRKKKATVLNEQQFIYTAAAQRDFFRVPTPPYVG